MEPTLLQEYEENGMKIQEYTKDGETVSHRVEIPIVTEELHAGPSLEERIVLLQEAVDFILMNF